MEAATEEIQKENSVTENNEMQNEKSPPPHSQGSHKKSKKEDRLKKDDKMVEQFIKSINTVSTDKEKLSLVCKKYLQGADDNKKMQFYIKQSDKRNALVLKEKEQLQHEFNKAMLINSKLENLCRELQKQNKAIKEESLLKIRQEEEQRKETHAKFQNTLSEVNALLQQNNEKNAKLYDDNISMTEKFKSVMQQCQLREEQLDKMVQQRALESELANAKFQKASLEHQAEKEQLLSEIQQLKVIIAQHKAKVMELQKNETALKDQLAIYMDKYDEFQNAFVKSNEVFGGFKEQMEKMSKKVQKSEKESLSWKKRWEGSQSALLEMCGERQASEERAAASLRQLHHMQSLCRTLQAERTVLLNTLKENNIERPPLPAPTPAPAPPTLTPAPGSASASDAKIEATAANCAQLRKSLAHLQSQLDVLTTKNGTKEELAKPEKQKKSKSKKNKAEKQKLAVAGNSKELKTDESTGKESTDEIPKEEVNQVKLEDIETSKLLVVSSLTDAKTGDGIDEYSSEVLASDVSPADRDGEVIMTPIIDSPNEESNSTEHIQVSDRSTHELSSNEEVDHLAEEKPIHCEEQA